jgi:hypothetical protein
MAGFSVDAFRHFQLAEMLEDDGLAVMLYRQLHECSRTLIGYLAQTWLPHMTFRVPRTGISRSAYFRPAPPRRTLQFG